MLFLLVTGLTFAIAPHLLRVLGIIIRLLMVIPGQVVVSSATAVRRAELATRAQITTAEELAIVTRDVDRQGRRVLAPRLPNWRNSSTATRSSPTRPTGKADAASPGRCAPGCPAWPADNAAW